MRAVVQRVLRASVDVAEPDHADDGLPNRGGDARLRTAPALRRVAEMGAGLLVLVGVGHDDTEADAQSLIRKIVGLRVFEDAEGKMNESLADVGGTLCLVSQFTLWADVRKGRRPSFGDAAAPEVAEPLFDAAVRFARAQDVPVVTGCFGEHMKVSLENDGPMTLLIDTERRF
ncbi:MAG: D-aminoacyl-tRNA deacylase [Myxococcota bacterium]